MKKANKGVRLSCTRSLKQQPPNHGVEKKMSVPATCPTKGMTIPTNEGDRSPVQNGMIAIKAQVSGIAAQSGSRKASGRADRACFKSLLSKIAPYMARRFTTSTLLSILNTAVNPVIPVKTGI